MSPAVSGGWTSAVRDAARHGRGLARARRDDRCKLVESRAQLVEALDDPARPGEIVDRLLVIGESHPEPLDSNAQPVDLLRRLRERFSLHRTLPASARSRSARRAPRHAPVGMHARSPTRPPSV